MSETILVRNVSRRPQDIEGGQVLAHNEEGQAPDSPHTRALLGDGALIALEPVKPPTVEQLREQAETLGINLPAKATKAEVEQALADHTGTNEES